MKTTLTIFLLSFVFALDAQTKTTPIEALLFFESRRSYTYESPLSLGEKLDDTVVLNFPESSIHSNTVISPSHGMKLDLNRANQFVELKKLSERAAEIGEKLKARRDVTTRIILVNRAILEGTNSISVKCKKAFPRINGKFTEVYYTEYGVGEKVCRTSEHLRDLIDTFGAAVAEVKDKQAKLKELYGIK